MVYIRNLSSSMSSSELKKRFEVFGEIVECQVLSRTNRWVGSELWSRAPAATGSSSPQAPQHCQCHINALGQPSPRSWCFDQGDSVCPEIHLWDGGVKE